MSNGTDIPMDIFTATMIAEGVDGFATDDPARFIEAWQLLIDTGTCWGLQGFFGRTAANLIEAGVCYPANVPATEREPIDEDLVDQMFGC